MQTPTPDFDLTLFKQRLNETIIWCRYKIAQSPTHTSEILWSLFDSALKHVDRYGSTSHKPTIPLADYAAATIARRSQLVAELPPQPAVDGSLLGGRFLIFDAGGSMFDGAAEDASNDFFDVDNCPACDTWVHLWAYPDDKNYAYIVSWVPPEFIRDADAGISVNPEMCIWWLDERDASHGWTQPDPSFLTQLKAAGFV